VPARYTLDDLTGLSDQELADALFGNPRAYMAVRGAVAEKRLERHLEDLQERQEIRGFRRGQSDSDKDFYVEIEGRETPLTLECKNVEVLKVGSPAQRGVNYIRFLLDEEYLTNEEALEIYDKYRCGAQCSKAVPEVASREALLELLVERGNGLVLKAFLKALPQQLKESGIPRFEFSAHLLAHQHGQPEPTIGVQPTTEFLERFADFPITIDFQKTRNQLDGGGGGNGGPRLYRVGEIDMVAACLFTRTLKWEFLFAKTGPSFRIQEGCYHNTLQVIPGAWDSSLVAALHLKQPEYAKRVRARGRSKAMGDLFAFL
jgi:hypothetical protein